MADIAKIEAQPREKVGKGASRAARRAGMVPCIIYGDSKDPLSIQIPQNEIIRLINRGGFLSQGYEITVEKKKHAVLPRDLQLHPVTDLPMHIDFLRIGKGMTVTMNVPVHIIGEEDCPGLTRGGTLNTTRHDVELNVPANDIPEYIEADISALDINDSVRISDITLPEGVTPAVTDRDFIICAVVAPSALKSADDEAEDEVAEDKVPTVGDDEQAEEKSEE